VVTVISFAATRFLSEEMNLTGSEVCRIPKNALLVYAYRKVSTKSQAYWWHFCGGGVSEDTPAECEHIWHCNCRSSCV